VLVGFACNDDRTITPPTVAALVIFPDTATATVGDSVVLQAVARDQNGHAFIGAPTAWTSRRPAVATVSAAGLVKALASGTDTIAATSGALTATAVITVVAPPSLAFTRDSVGLTATANGPNPGADSVTVVNPGGGALAGVALGTISYGAGASGWLGATLRGTATPDVLVLTAQTGTLAVGSYTATVPVMAAAATNSPHSLKVSFTVGVGAAASMAAYGGNAQSATVSTAVAVAPSVIVRDQFTNPVPGTTISFAVRSGGGSVTGGTQQTNASGIAAVGSWTLGTTAGPDTLMATSGSLSGSPVTFNATATPGPATKLAFTQQPTTAQAGVPITPAVQVSAQDAYGNTATSYGTAITVAIGTNPAAGTLSGTTSALPSAGAATFANLSIDKTGTGYTLVTASGSLSGATSSGFTVNPSTTPAGSKSTLIASTPAITASSGASTTLITVTVRDTFANPIPGAAVALGATGTGNTFSPGATGTTDGTGVLQASFSSTKAEAKTISAVANASVAIIQTAAVTVNPAAVSASQSSVVATTTAITACSTGCVAGSTASTLTVTVRDAFNNPIGSAAVTPAASGGTGNTLAPSSGTSNGSGVFTTTFNSTGAGPKTLSATAGGTAITQTTAVTVTAAAPATLAVNGGNSQVARVGTAVATAPAALVTDAFGNLVSSVSVTFGSLTGGGNVTGSPATTNGSGVATLGSWTLGSSAGDSLHGAYVNTVTASASGTNTVQFADSGFYSLASDVMPIFATTAAGPCSSCHSAGFPPDFSSAANFFNSAVSKTGSCNVSYQRVAPGNWGGSLLGVLMNASGPAGCAQPVMPTTGALPAATRRIISDWVNRSALNN
jgi:hypothetical protein